MMISSKPLHLVCDSLELSCVSFCWELTLLFPSVKSHQIWAIGFPKTLRIFKLLILLGELGTVESFRVFAVCIIRV